MQDEIVNEFLVESYENLDALDRDLVALEDCPDDRAKLASIFRTIHTIKGTSGFLAFEKLERVAHVGENLLVPLRDGDLRLTNDIADALLGMVDAVRQILRNIEENGQEGDEDYERLTKTLERLRHGDSADEDSPTDATSVTPSHNHAEGEREQAAKHVESKLEDSMESPECESTESRSAHVLHDVDSHWHEERECAEPAESMSPAVESTLRGEPGPTARSSQAGHAIADSTVRIDVRILDTLMNLVGELVLARNQILQYSRTTEDTIITTASQRLNLITTELQEGVMKTRMQPIRNAWSKLPRVVRDLSASCGKRVNVRMEGEDTELDKTILEAIKDPLTHVVRNSVDHGIEAPAERKKGGKPEEGTLWLRAFHEGGQVNIEIADDGGGINLERVKAKAIQKNLVTPEQVEGMSDRELTNLILLPGFSTAEQVTNVSGRGVGMDVVKTNVEKIGGTLDIQSVMGHGTTLRIKIPLTLAIVPALLITCGKDRYAIPQVSLLELVRIERERARKEIDQIHSVPVYRLRGHLLPLLYLDEQLGLRAHRKTKEEYADADVINIVVLQAEDRHFGLVVDHISDTQEIVVKPLSEHLKSIPHYAGSTIMGDGNVALILDVIGLARQGNIVTEHRDTQLSEMKSIQSDQVEQRQSLLIVDPGDGTRAAVPLASVARLEEIDPASVERAADQDVVQYRGQIMPLIRLKSHSYGMSSFGDDNFDEVKNKLQVVVYSYAGHSIGFVAKQIIDVVDHESSDIDQTTMVISGRVTEMIDLESIARNNLPQLA